MNLAHQPASRTQHRGLYREGGNSFPSFFWTVINEVLDMFRIEVGKIELEISHSTSYHLADQIRNLFKKRSRKGVSYIVEMKDVERPLCGRR